MKRFTVSIQFVLVYVCCSLALYTKLLQDGTALLIWPYGADVIGLDSKFTRIVPYPTQCNGLWSCTEEMCNMSVQPNVYVVGLRSHSPTEDEPEGRTYLSDEVICQLSQAAVIKRATSYAVFSASRICLIVSVTIEALSVVSLAIFTLTQKSAGLCLTRWSFLLSLVLLIVSYSLELRFYTVYKSLYGDTPPLYLVFWTNLSLAFLLVTTIITTLYGATKLSVDITDPELMPILRSATFG